ncbi:MAG: pilus assembly protein [Beijerinckiaceae bacterium]|nr:pilus assembly protein [Beijerinckiaceae bacterium]
MFRKLAAKLATDEDGATAVEFGMVAAPFLGIVLAIVQSSMTMLVTQGLDAAVQDAARQVMTGQALENGGATNAALFRDRYICNPVAPAVRTLPSFIDCSKLIVDMRVASNFANADVTSTFSTTASTCPGGPRQIVILRVLYHSPVFAPFLAMNGLLAAGSVQAGQVIVDGQPRYALTATAAFRNEPFQGASPC